MFETYGEYLFYLLFSPLKQKPLATNQFYIFLKAVGQLFDKTKENIFKLRLEASVTSCSESLLEEQGLDRGLVRLKGETAESFRQRIQMKPLIEELGGTDEAIYYVAKAFGYSDVLVEINPDSQRWAEATVTFIGGNIVVDDRALLLKELGRAKMAAVKLSLEKEQRYRGTLYLACGMVIGKQRTFRQG